MRADLNEETIEHRQPHFDSRTTDRTNNLWRPTAGKKRADFDESIRSHQTVVIRQISRNRAEQIAYYRVALRNNKTLILWLLSPGQLGLLLGLEDGRPIALADPWYAHFGAWPETD